jgi:hypothetical protein
LETAGEKLLAQIWPPRVEDVNVFMGLRLIVEPRLKDANRWYVIADPAEFDGLEICLSERQCRAANRGAGRLQN